MRKRRLAPFYVGLLGIASLILLIIGLGYLKGYSVLATTTTFYAIFDDVKGLKPGDQVLLQGMQIGQISELTYDPKLQKVVVKFWVQSDIDVPQDSEVEAFAKDFLGTMALSLKVGKKREYLRSGDTLKAYLRPDLFDELRTIVYPLKEELESRLKELQPILLGLKELLGDTIQNRKTAQNLHATIQNLQNLSKSLQQLTTSFYKVSEKAHNVLSDNSQHLSQSLQNIEKITGGLANQSETIEQLLCNLKENTGKLNLLLDSLNHGEGTAARVIHDPKLYEYLAQTAKDLDRLLVELREHPERFIHFSVFGRREKNKKK